MIDEEIDLKTRLKLLDNSENQNDEQIFKLRREQLKEIEMETANGTIIGS